jgi:copper chaperone CopZ
MKKTVFVVLALLFIAGTFVALNSGATRYSNGHTVEMSVSRLTCGACVENIRAAVSALNGTGAIETNVAAARSTVVFNPDNVKAEQIASTITDAGYPATILSVKDTDGHQVAGIDTERFVAKVGSRMVTREVFDQALKQRLQTAELSGQPVQIRTLYTETWSSLLRQELLYNAASQFGVSVDEAELNRLATETGGSHKSDREDLRENMIIEYYLAQQFPDRQPNVIEMNNLLNNLYATTTVDIFDSSLKRSLASGNGSGGCGGGCCG